MADFDGDGKADIAIYRPVDSVWQIRQSSNGAFSSRQWGDSHDMPVPADYDGDGKADLAMWSPSSMTWYVERSSDRRVIYQALTDVPPPDYGDYGTLYPVVGDFTGDGKADFGMMFKRWYGVDWHQAALFKIQGLTGWSDRGEAWDGDQPTPAIVAGDYDGNGTTDVASIWLTPFDSWWQFSKSGSGVPEVEWGAQPDVEVVGDFDGDHKDDVAIYRDADAGSTHIRLSTGGTTRIPWNPGTPVPADYDGDRIDDIATWTNGVWNIRYSTGVVKPAPTLGQAGEIPI